jgi:hypothetical protein
MSRLRKKSAILILATDKHGETQIRKSVAKKNSK